MPELTVVSIEHACPMVGDATSCTLQSVIGSANDRGAYRAKSFHEGNDLYVVKLANRTNTDEK